MKTEQISPLLAPLLVEENIKLLRECQRLRRLGSGGAASVRWSGSPAAISVEKDSDRPRMALFSTKSPAQIALGAFATTLGYYCNRGEMLLASSAAALMGIATQRPFPGTLPDAEKPSLYHHAGL